MLFQSTFLALAVSVALASPVAIPLKGPSLEERQGGTRIFGIYTTYKWVTNVAPGTGASDGGEEVNIGEGFSLVTESGVTLYNVPNAEGYALCTDFGQQIEISGGCLSNAVRFSCASTFAGDTGSCAVWQPDSAGLPVLNDCHDAENGPSYTVFTAGQQGVCVVGFNTIGTCDPALPYLSEFTYKKVESAAPPCNPNP